jgi:hypothetical protein
MAYGIQHVPLMATVQHNRRKGGKPVAFIDGQLCFFAHGTPVPAVGETVEVMIVRPIHPMDAEDRFRDFDKLVGLEIQIVDPLKHLLVAIDGFEMSGSGCAVSALGCETNGRRPLNRGDLYLGSGSGQVRLRDSFTVTPGRTGVRYHGERWDGTRTWVDGIPTNIWVDRDPKTGKAQRRARVAGDRMTVRAAGLTRIEDLECAELARPATVQRKAA